MTGRYIRRLYAPATTSRRRNENAYSNYNVQKKHSEGDL
jgi:hypothetical protein